MTPPPNAAPTFKHRLEFAATRGAARLFSALPEAGAQALARAIAWLGFHIVRFRRAAAERRIREVFGASCTPAAARAIAWQSFLNLTLTVAESLRADRLDADWLDRHVEDDGGFELMRARCAEGHGAVLALPHMGSWELAGAAARIKGIPLFSIAARQKNPLFTAWLNQRRAAGGVDILTRGEDSLRVVPRLLKQGKCFAILPDVRVPQPGLPVPFLGGTANAGPGMALFARLANVPIYPCILTRLKQGRHRFHVLEPVFPDSRQPREADLLRMTCAVLARIDQAIRADPGQWFWYNKRWILDPLDPLATPPPPFA